METKQSVKIILKDGALQYKRKTFPVYLNINAPKADKILIYRHIMIETITKYLQTVVVQFHHVTSVRRTIRPRMMR